MLTGGAGQRAMARALEDLFAIANPLHGIPMAGRTDAWILTQTAIANGIPPDAPALARFPNVYVQHLATELEKPGPRKGIMPGVRELLDLLSSRDDVFLALLTGNYAASAKIKLEYFDLWRYFRCGAFGDEVPDRNSLLPRAVTEVAACGGPFVNSADAIVIGDTPLDIACAAAGGARSIGVATGFHRAEELRAAGADVVFENFADTSAVLAAMNL